MFPGDEPASDRGWIKNGVRRSAEEIVRDRRMLRTSKYDPSPTDRFSEETSLSERSVVLVETGRSQYSDRERPTRFARSVRVERAD